MANKRNIPANMVKVDDRKIVENGTSLCVSVPPAILREAGVGKGDTVSIWNNGKGQVLVDLKPDEG